MTLADKQASARGKKRPQGLPSRAQVLEFIQTQEGPAGKREIARAFGLKGQEKIALKRLLKDMAEEGLIDGRKSAYHRMGGVPKVTVLRVIAIDDEAAPIAIPDNWPEEATGEPVRLTVRERPQKRRAQTYGALKIGDRVLARTEERATGWIAHPMKKLPARSQGLIGVVERDAAGKAWLAPVDRRVRHSYPITDLGGADEGQLVIAEGSGRSLRAGVKVVEVVGDPLAPGNFSLIAIAKHAIPHTFSPEALAQAQDAAQLELSQETREDLTHLPIVAIDPGDARDHDDAIWAREDGEGGFDALVAIADVSFYVRPGSAIDREARKRGNSVYFPDKVVPMLPEILSSDVCSLKAGEERAAMVCHMHISPEGRISQFRFARARVRIAHNHTYEAAQAAVDSDNPPEHLVQLWQAWRALSKARKAREPLDLDLPERRVVLDDTGQICEVAVQDRLDAHRVVEDFMIAANVAAAKALESKAAPIVYRVHEPPSREKLIALRDYLETLGKKLALGQVIKPALFNAVLARIDDEGDRPQLTDAILRSQMQAYYGPRNAGHFGLALGSYAHFTSPIRRYADVLVHRALVDSFALEQPLRQDSGSSKAIPRASGLSEPDRANLQQICDQVSTAERRAMEAERETLDRYFAAWLSDRVGENFPTRITSVQAFGFFASIEGLGGDGLVPISTLGDEPFAHDARAQALIGESSGTRYQIGDCLTLQLAEANRLTGSLKFVPIDSDGKAIEPGPHPANARRGRKYSGGKRGRPANIRHQGKRRR